MRALFKKEEESLMIELTYLALSLSFLVHI